MPELLVPLCCLLGRIDLPNHARPPHADQNHAVLRTVTCGTWWFPQLNIEALPWTMENRVSNSAPTLINHRKPSFNKTTVQSSYQTIHPCQHHPPSPRHNAGEHRTAQESAQNQLVPRVDARASKAQGLDWTCHVRWCKVEPDLRCVYIYIYICSWLYIYTCYYA